MGSNDKNQAGPSAVPPSDTARQATVERLCEHFARDALTTPELERRLDLAYAARTRGELLALEDDLPALEPANGPAFQAAEARPPVLIDTGRSGPERDLIVAIGSGTERKGGWTPARNLTALAMMGSVELDLREAVFTAPEIQLRAAVLMANVSVIVPPGVGVEWGGIALMGGVTTPERTGPPARDGPVVRIDGLVCMGGVEVVERLAGESAREARKRRRREKSARRRIDSGHDPYAGADR